MGHFTRAPGQIPLFGRKVWMQLWLDLCHVCPLGLWKFCPMNTLRFWVGMRPRNLTGSLHTSPRSNTAFGSKSMNAIVVGLVPRMSTWSLEVLSHEHIALLSRDATPKSYCGATKVRTSWILIRGGSKTKGPQYNVICGMVHPSQTQPSSNLVF